MKTQKEINKNTIQSFNLINTNLKFRARNNLKCTRGGPQRPEGSLEMKLKIEHE